MKKQLFSFFSMPAGPSSAGKKTWRNDPMHSRLGFVVRHLTISEINGRFSDFNITVTTAMPDYSDVQVELTAQTASIDTESVPRNNHLKTADFFDVEKYPALTFKSTLFRQIENHEFLLEGDLSFHGITKTITLETVFYGSVTNPMNNQETVGFKVTGNIKRSDFGIGPNFPEIIIGDNVRIIANIEFSPD